MNHYPSKAVSSSAPADGALLDVAAVFPDARMFDNRDALRAYGFDIIDKDDDGIMIGSHPSLPRFMFKKYPNKTKPAKELENYQLRTDGSNAIRAFIAEKKLTRVVAPQKWIRALPCAPSTHILVCEKIDVLTKRDSEKAYLQIGEQTLRDLCVFTHRFSGLDSGVRNMLVTTDGKIAFIDTERWEEDRREKRKPLKHLREHLTRDNLERVKTIFKQLG